MQSARLTWKTHFSLNRNRKVLFENKYKEAKENQTHFKPICPGMSLSTNLAVFFNIVKREGGRTHYKKYRFRKGLNVGSWGNSSIPEGRFSKWF